MAKFGRNILGTDDQRFEGTQPPVQQRRRSQPTPTGIDESNAIASVVITWKDGRQRAYRANQMDEVVATIKGSSLIRRFWVCNGADRDHCAYYNDHDILMQARDQLGVTLDNPEEAAARLNFIAIRLAIDESGAILTRNGRPINVDEDPPHAGTT